MSCERRHISCSSKVLLPAPGLPPISTAEPGTRPPPSTRSNSPMEVEKRGCSSRSMLPRVCTPETVPAKPARLKFCGEEGAVAAPRLTRLRVFQALQAAHWPCHCLWSAPQSVHTKADLVFAMELPVWRGLSIGMIAEAAAPYLP